MRDYMSSSQGLEQYGTPLPNRCRGPPMGSAQVLRGRGSGQGSERVLRGSTPRPAPNGCHKDGEGFWIHGPCTRHPHQHTSTMLQMPLERHCHCSQLPSTTISREDAPEIDLRPAIANATA
ncbi:uncharacterized protein LOC142569724 isoform X1 [Dermacentor variabilis]|uniref:uncharacterized protein LOC142569724 isoform X1 n=1 Tax=Dermacentor variabilis TaxID=34621 RepID=UPI003F5AFFAF